jgi:hypothetical protein
MALVKQSDKYVTKGTAIAFAPLATGRRDHGEAQLS